METDLWLWLPFLVTFLIALASLGVKEMLSQRRHREGESDSVILPPSREQIVDDLYILDRPEGPREVMGLMTTKEVADILEREPKFDIVIDMRIREQDVFDQPVGTAAARERAKRDKEDRKAKPMLERMTRSEILAVLDRRGPRPTMEEKQDSLILIDTILRIRERRAADGAYDSEFASLMDEAWNALNRCSDRMDSERIVKRLAAALLEAWTDRPGRRRAESARFERVVTAALDILERRTRGKSNTSTYELRVAASLEALNREAPTASPYKGS